MRAVEIDVEVGSSFISEISIDDDVNDTASIDAPANSKFKSDSVRGAFIEHLGRELQLESQDWACAPEVNPLVLSGRTKG